MESPAFAALKAPIRSVRKHLRRWLAWRLLRAMHCSSDYPVSTDGARVNIAANKMQPAMWGRRMTTTTRRDLLTAGLAVAGAAAAPVGAPADDHDHGHQDVPSDPALRVKALESLLVAKGLVDRAALDAAIDAYEHRIGPHLGAQVVARAWTAPDFRQRLLADGTSAIAELGYGGQPIVVVENTPAMHNVVVCTLCSCYPWALLGLPPTWYKSAAYRSRCVIDPRGVLHELGLDLSDDVEVRVWDSTAEKRYFVLPERPAGTEGMSSEALAKLVTRDAMIGVAKIGQARLPGDPA